MCKCVNCVKECKNFFLLNLIFYLKYKYHTTYIMSQNKDMLSKEIQNKVL